MSLDLNVTYVIVLGLFLVLLIFLNALVFKPFLKLFEERHERIEGSVKRAEQMLERAEEQAKTFADRIKVATQRGLEARNQIRAEAQASMNARLDEERAKLAAKLSEAKAELAAKRADALADVGTQAVQIAEITAQKLLGRAL